ncbi:trehalose-6-phosphate synthase 1 [Culex quinquefasciatus]|uniref:Trehalose 6-phosphate phosphatase n=1 Tax=Culex quinquefasciatus TaxID=7176 RepID=B0WQL2_CULQU|nr:probable trehalose-phosphate phosphatase J [Culex quinquefasciatus]EDS32887.1 trehalose-6-phosphate synthase 1 [Culex quinquefasciatus]|eukprot:XP_001850996.1 trehalose-6-phosphate synthase 1 [Culex quinquefasciatus]
MTINAIVKLVALIVVHSCCTESSTTTSSDSGAAQQLSHFNVDSAPDKMSTPDFDQYLGSYIADGERIALILDYDGTLAEITAHPNLTQMTPQMKSTLQNIANSGKAFVAVISGRDVYGVKEKIGIENIVYSGNHGLEVLYPDGTKHNQGIPKEIADNFTKMIDQLTKELAKDGAWVEDKKVSLTFHYRQVDAKLVPELEVRAKQIIESYGYRANQAHAAVEGKPPIKWNKGLAAEYILTDSFDTNWRQRKVIFAGDDTTDEDVMQAIKGSGRSFRVSKDPQVETHADFRIPSVDAVYQLLKWLEKKVTK